MNTTLITILIVEIIAGGLIIGGLVVLNKKVNLCRQQVSTLNKKLSKMLPTTRDIFTLTHQYIEMWKEEFGKKVEACGNLLGELTVYYILHKIFKKRYESFETGYSFIKLFW